MAKPYDRNLKELYVTLQTKQGMSAARAGAVVDNLHRHVVGKKMVQAYLKGGK